jgi:hypothetical protein
VNADSAVSLECAGCGERTRVRSRDAFASFDERHRQACGQPVLDPEQVEDILNLPPWAPGSEGSTDSKTHGVGAHARQLVSRLAGHRR